MPPKLLLADDSVTIQRVIELTFADEGIQVIAVGDGQQAIERMERERPDIVLADVGMPEKNGYEVAAFVKGHPSLAHIPVVLLTGAFEPVDEARARAIGCDGVLVKPFEPQVVIHRVRELLAGRRPPELWTTSPEVERGATPGLGGRVGPANLAGPHAPPPAAGDVPSATASAPDAASVAPSLEEYFDRLDAAFAGLRAGAPPASAGSEEMGVPAPGSAPASRSTAATAERPGIEEELARWEEEGGPASQKRGQAAASAEPAPSAVPAASSAGPPTAAGPVVAPPPLADAFAALLAAEERGSVPPVSWGPTTAPDVLVTDELVELVTRRVVERLTDRLVRETVAEIVSQVAERLVREEIERLKQSVT